MNDEPILVHMTLRPTLAIALLASATLVMAQAGTLDQSFGTNGYVTFYFGGENTFPTDALVLPNGQILAVTAIYNPTADIALERYNADGSLDASFGDAGVVTIDVNAGSNDRPGEAVLLPDGKILIGGKSDGGILLLRVEQDGSVDTSFGTDGWLTLDQDPDEVDYPWGFVVRPTGEIVVINTVDVSIGNGYGSVIQFTADGALDAAFGTNGVLTIDNGSTNATEWLYAIALASSGDVYVLGSAFVEINGTDETFVYRVTPSGSLDPAFDGEGYRLLPIGTESEVPSVITVLPNDQVLVGGTTTMGVVDHPFLAKLNGDGSYDPTFGSAGVQIMTAIHSQGISELFILPGGQILMSGQASNGVGTDMLIARLHADGSFDTGFGTEGVTRTLIGSPAGWESGGALALAADGNYIMTGVTGTSFAGTSTQVLLKYLSGNLAGMAEGNSPPVHFHPNPTSGQLWVSAPGALRSLGLHIVDLDGRSVGNVNPNGDGSVQLPASLQPGTYFISSTDHARFPPQRIVLMP